jgi:hypothetical protein
VRSKPSRLFFLLASIFGALIDAEAADETVADEAAEADADGLEDGPGVGLEDGPADGPAAG